MTFEITEKSAILQNYWSVLVFYCYQEGRDLHLVLAILMLLKMNSSKDLFQNSEHSPDLHSVLLDSPSILFLDGDKHRGLCFLARAHRDEQSTHYNALGCPICSCYIKKSTCLVPSFFLTFIMKMNPTAWKTWKISKQRHEISIYLVQLTLFYHRGRASLCSPGWART